MISLGSNLGNRLETLQGAVDALEDTPGVRVKAVSPGLRDRAVGRRARQPAAYFNAVVLVRTTLPPGSLLERGHAIEEAFHRVRDERWGPRTIDVDIVAYQGVVSDDPRARRSRTRGRTSGPSSSRRGTTSTRAPRCPAAARWPTCCPRWPGRGRAPG